MEVSGQLYSRERAPGIHWSGCVGEEEKELIYTPLLKKFTAFHATPKLTTVFTRTLYQSLS
jgi:hypothetical protein